MIISYKIKKIKMEKGGFFTFFGKIPFWKMFFYALGKKSPRGVSRKVDLYLFPWYNGTERNGGFL